MWSFRAPPGAERTAAAGLAVPVAWLAWLALALLLGACASHPSPAWAKGHPPAFVHKVEPTDLFPRDLDLVVRLDVERMRIALGAAATKELGDRAVREAGDDVFGSALACADVVWLGTRLGEVGAGDHVAVVEGKGCSPRLDPSAWAPVRSANGAVKILDHAGHVPRSGTARILSLGPDVTAFVSPVERDSVRRIFEDGPDETHGSPTATGLLSFDFRAGRLASGLERRFPSIAAILAGLSRVRGAATLADDGIRVDAEITSPTTQGAERALAFLEALRDNLSAPRYREVVAATKLERVETTVVVRVTVPAKLILGAMSAPPPISEAPPPPSSEAPPPKSPTP